MPAPGGPKHGRPVASFPKPDVAGGDTRGQRQEPEAPQPPRGRGPAQRSLRGWAGPPLDGAAAPAVRCGAGVPAGWPRGCGGQGQRQCPPHSPPRTSPHRPGVAPRTCSRGGHRRDGRAAGRPTRGGHRGSPRGTPAQCSRPPAPPAGTAPRPQTQPYAGCPAAATPNRIRGSMKIHLHVRVCGLCHPLEHTPEFILWSQKPFPSL